MPQYGCFLIFLQIYLATVLVSSSSQPAMMAIMLEQLGLQPGHRVLEVGAGSGYNAGLMAHIVGDSGQVTAIDIDEDLVEGARNGLREAGRDAVTVVCQDGVFGDPDHAPYDRIILTVAAWDIAPAWREQLKPGGRLLLPLEVGRSVQKSIAFDKTGDQLKSASVKDCGFMPLRGDFARPLEYIPLGPDPGLVVSVDDPDKVDGEVVYRLLSGPFEYAPTGIYATQGEVIFGGLALWLSLHEPCFCVLSAEGQMANRGIVPGLMELSGDRRQLVLPVTSTIFAGRYGVIIRYGGTVDYRPTNQAIEAETYGRQDTGNGSGQGWDERAFRAQVAEWAIAVAGETGASVAHSAGSLRRGVGG